MQQIPFFFSVSMIYFSIELLADLTIAAADLAFVFLQASVGSSSTTWVHHSLGTRRPKFTEQRRESDQLTALSQHSGKNARPVL